MSTAYEQALAKAREKEASLAGNRSAYEQALETARANEAAMQQAADAVQREQTEAIGQIASAYAFDAGNLGPSPLTMGQGSRTVPQNVRQNPYASALEGLRATAAARQPSREAAISQTLRATKAAQLGLPSLAGGMDVDRSGIGSDPRFADQAQRRQNQQIQQQAAAARGPLVQREATMPETMTGRSKVKTQTALNEQARERMERLTTMDPAAERARHQAADQMMDSIDALRELAEKAETARDPESARAIRWNLEQQEQEYGRLYGDLPEASEIDEAEKLQRILTLEGVRDAGDFWGKSQYDPAFGSSATWSGARQGYDVEGDLLYDYVNDKNGSRSVAFTNAMLGEHGGIDLDYVKEMTPEERRVYNYLYATDGRERAEEYLELITSDLNARQMSRMTQEWAEYAQDHPVAASAISVAMSPLRGAAYVGQAADLLDDGSIDPNAAYNKYSRIPTAIRSQVSGEVEKRYGKAGSFLYDTGMSMADFITQAAITGGITGGGPVAEALTLGIMGTGAAADATIAAKERGLSDEQAFALGTIAGAAEILTEKISLETLLDKTALEKSLIGYLFKNAVAEGSEEVGSDFINLFADVLIAKDKGEWAESVQKYKDLGQDDSRAFWSAFVDQAKTMGWDFLGGALSGVAMASGSAAIHAEARKIQQRQITDALETLRQATERAQAEETRLADWWGEEQLALAQQMTEDGASPEIVYAQTGWRQDENGEWTQGGEETAEGDAISVQADAAPETGGDLIVEEIRKMDPEYDELNAEDQRTYRQVQEQALSEAQAMTAAGADPAEVYNQTGWTQDAAGNWTKTMEETADATAPAQSAAEENVTDIEQGGSDDAILLHESGERTDGAGAGGQAGQLAEGTGETADAGRTGGAAIRNRLNAANASEAKSTKDFGVENGLEIKDLQEIPAGTDAELQGLSELGQAMGVNVRFVNHQMQVRNPNTGKIQNVGAVYNGREIIACATMRDNSATSLTMHELYHAIQDANEAMTEAIWEQLENDYGTEAMEQLYKQIYSAYKGIYGKSEKAVQLYKQEVIADLYGGLDRPSLGYTPEMQQTVQEAANAPQWVTPGEARESGSRRAGQRYAAESTEEDLTAFEAARRAGSEETALQPQEEPAALQDLTKPEDVDRETIEEVAPQVRYSLAYEENGQHVRDLEKNYSEESAAELGELIQKTEAVTQMWRAVSERVNSSIVDEWNRRQGSDRVFTVFKAQMGYKYNAELSSMCKKGIPLFEAIDSLVQKDTIKRLNSQTLGLEEKKILYEILQDRGFEIPCAICFVEQSRQREGVLINNFLHGDGEGKLGWNNALDDLERRMETAGEPYTFRQMDRSIATDRYDWRATAQEMTAPQQQAFEQALIDACNEEIDRYNETAKRKRKHLTSLSAAAIKASLGGTISSNLKIYKVLATEPQSRLHIDPSLLYSSYTTRNLAKSGNHNQLYSLFNAQGGVSGAKSKQRAEVYWGDVLGKKWSPSKVRDETGLRNQSNSGFQMITFLDQAQLYSDLTAKGYYLQAYTKTLTEAKLFGLSNAKINCSLIPAVQIYRNADGSVDVERTPRTAGLNAAGELIFDDIEGIDHNEYIMLRSIPDYSQSLGGTCIGYSDAHILKLLDTDYVTQVIGYHDKTNDPAKRYRGATYAKNYNGENEAVDQKTGKTVHLSFSEFLRQAEQRFRPEGEDFAGTTTYGGREWTADEIPQLAAQLYKDTCDRRGYSYAYPQFAEHELLQTAGGFSGDGQPRPLCTAQKGQLQPADAGADPRGGRKRLLDGYGGLCRAEPAERDNGHRAHRRGDGRDRTGQPDGGIRPPDK